MTIDMVRDEGRLTVSVSGRMDTMTAPDVDKAIKGELDSVSELVFDFSDLDYISSSGLRVLLSAQKTMNKQGSMCIRNVGPIIMEVFEITGFVDILTIV